MPKVEIDAEAPDFRLKDFRGNDFELSHLRGRNNALLVFNRGFG
jgi:peroxiredoxin